MFMCHRHHKETDNVEEYPVEKLKEIKAKHESQYTESGKNLTNEMFAQIQREQEYYWNHISEKRYEPQDWKIERDFELNIHNLFDELDEHIRNTESNLNTLSQSDSDEQLEKDLRCFFKLAKVDFPDMKNIPYFENPFISRNWELHNLGSSNTLSHIKLCILQLKLKIFEMLLSNEPQKKEYIDTVKQLRNQFELLYDNSYYAD